MPTRKTLNFAIMKRKNTILISLLMLLVVAVIIFNQRNIFSISHKYKKTEFLAEVDQAMRKALKEIDYELFNKCVMHSEDSTYIDELLRDFEKMKMENDTLNSDYEDLEEIDRYESLMLKYLVESKSNFDFQSLGSHFVDSVVRSCFEQFAIDATYELGLYRPLESHFLFQTTGKYEQELLNEGVRFEVFSPRSGDVPIFDQMIVYFPDLDSWLTKQNTSLYILITIVSLFLIFSIVIAFIIFKRQRELANFKSSLINNMTHELKTPVSTIGLACEALQDPNFDKNDALINTYIRIIKEENDKNKQMIDNVLNIVRNDKKLKSNEEDVHINQALQAIVSMYKLTAEKKNAHISLLLNAKDDLIWADKVHISNALSNIIDNALKYSPRNPEITIATRNNAKGKIFISIKDNGIGIKKADQKKIFDEFFRVDTGNIHSVKGHGLGLHYVKQVVDWHHGKITVESRLGEGTNFVISLPLKKINIK